MIPVLIASSFFAALVISILLNELALIPWRRSVGAHWTERARLLFPARRAARINIFFLVMMVIGVTGAVAPRLNPLETALATFFGALLAGYFFNRQIYPDMTFSQWLQFIVSLWILVFGVVFVILAAVIVMPGDFGWITWLVTAAALAVFLALQYGLNVRLLRSLGILKPAPERLVMLIRDVCEKMNTPAPTAWVVNLHFSNALVLPGPRELVFTAKLLAAHSDDEIKAICAHELGHLTEPKNARRARLLLPLCLFPVVLLRPIAYLIAPRLSGTSLDFPASALLCSFLIVCIPILFCFVFAVRLGRWGEKYADQVAVKYQEDPAVYARTLERLYQTNQSPAVLPRRMRPSPHPDLYDRMLAAGITPDFPRPAPPAKFSWSTGVLFAICCLPFVAHVFAIAHNIVITRLPQ
jgi:Zn-dependent protease with chaperone function